ncbi:MAG: hydroxyacid dehydrogenase [Brevinema sp.]
MKKLILVLDYLGEQAHQKLQTSPYEISVNPADLSKATALIVRSTRVTKEMIDEGTNLKIISRAGVGMDAIDTEYARSKNILLFNAAGGNSVNAAETTMGFILSIAHKITYSHHLLYGQKMWERGEKTEGFELDGKTLGIIGCGNVGSRVAQFARAFNMSVCIYDPYISNFPPNTESVPSLEILLPKCDMVTIHTPLTKETYHLMDEKYFGLMKKNAYLINASRGKVVDQKALINALKNKTIMGAALDVFEEEPLPLDSPLFDFDNIIMIPHLGGASSEARTRVSELAVENVFAHIQDQKCI